MYTVIGSIGSRTFRVLWLLEELGLDYSHLPASPRSEEVTAHYSAGKVPVMLVGAAALTDSVAIMTYLADRHARFTYPSGTLERARQDGHTMFLNDEFDALLWMAAKHSFVLPEEYRVPEIKPSLHWEYERSLARLEERLGDNPYLMGDAPTVPDFLAAHCSLWAENAKFPAPSDRLAAYFASMRERPAWKAVEARR